MATIALGSKSVGSIVKLKVDGTAREFIVVGQTVQSLRCILRWHLATFAGLLGAETLAQLQRQ